MGILLLYRVGINKNALIYSSYNAAREMLLLPTQSECQTQAFLGFGHGLFVHSSDQDVIEYYYRRPAGGRGGGQIGKAVAFGRSDLTVSYLYRQSLFSRFNGTKSKAWLFSETEIVNSKHINSEYAIYYY